MATTSLTFDIYAKDHASSTFNRFSSNVSSSSKSVGALKFSIGKLAGAFAGLAVIQKTTQFLSDSIAEARESNKVSAQTEAVLKSTKGAANLTADAIGDLANQLSLKAGIDDEAIQSGENLLLTFRNVRNEAGKGNDIFTQATKATLDLSVAMGKDLNSSTVLVGKALNDPIAGLSALTRVGVTFTSKQKATIQTLVETGHTLKAQKMILSELNKEFKGSAAAQADPADKAKVAWENLQESIGKKLMPVLDKLLIWFTSDVIPALQRFGDWFEKNVTPRIQEFIDMIVENWPQIVATVKPVLDEVIADVKAFVDLVMAIWDKWGDQILAVLKIAFQTGVALVRAALKVIKGVIDVVTGLIHGDWSLVWKGIREILGGAWDAMKATTVRALEFILDWLKSLPGKALNALGNLTMFLTGKGKDLIDGLWDGAKDIWDNFISWVKGLPARISRAVGGLKNKILNLFPTAAEIIKHIGEIVIHAAVNVDLPGGASLGDALKGAGSKFIPGLASGSPSFRGGLAVVGEHGPELVSLPRGSRVFNAAQTSQMGQAAGGADLARAVEAGMRRALEGARLRIDGNGNARLMIRQGAAG